jgi:putative ABC transport system permease protein
VLALYGPEGSFKNLSIDGRVLAFTALLSILSGLVFGLIPAMQGSNRNLTAMLKDSGRASTAGSSRQRLRSLLVVATIASALVLLTGTGLMINTFIRLVHVSPGFDTKNLLTFELLLPTGQYFQRRRYGQWANPGATQSSNSDGVRSGGRAAFSLAGRPVRRTVRHAAVVRLVVRNRLHAGHGL